MNLDEWSPGASAQVVDGPGQLALACAALAEEQDGCVGRRDLVGGCERSLHGRALGHEVRD